MKICSVDLCGIRHDAKGYCSKHYNRLRKYGNPHTVHSSRYERPAIVEGDYAKIPVVSKGSTHYAIVDKQFSYLDKYKWSFSNGYAACRITRHGRFTKMHRLIMGNPDGKIVDHRNGNTLDNRLENLRICSFIQNGANSTFPKRKLPRNIYCEENVKSPNKYRVRITKDRKLMSFGSYENIDEAIEARNSALSTLFGEYSFINR